MHILKTQRVIAGIAILSLLLWFCHQVDPASKALAASVRISASEHASTEPTLCDAEQPVVDTYLSAVKSFSSFTAPRQPAAQRSIQGEARVRGPVYDSTDSQTSGHNRLAHTCTVTSRNNSGVGTLRDCLQNAANDDIILFDATVFPRLRRSQF